MLDLLFFLLLGHYIGDFALQSDNLAENKKRSIRALSLHVLIYVIAVGAMLYLGLWYNHSEYLLQVVNLYALVGLFIVHWTQDFLKSRCIKCGRQVFYTDQALHLAVLYAMRIFIYNG